MKKLAIIYGSSTGMTETIASKIATYFDNADLFNAEDLDIKILDNYDFLILGTSTSGIGDLQDDWDMLLPKLAKIDLSKKKIALFGLGDSASFSTSFAGGMGAIYQALKGKTTIIGAVSKDGYTFDDSQALIDGKFVGLPLDEENEFNKTDERIKKWVTELKQEMK